METEHNESRKILLPSEGETIAIATKEKTAALCYDRILVPRISSSVGKDIPDSIRCFGESPFEIELLKLVEHWKELKILKDEKIISGKNQPLLANAFQNINSISSKISPDYSTQNKIDLKQFKKNLRDNPLLMASNLVRELSKSFSRKYGTPVVIVCASEKEKASLYNEGDRQVVVSMFSNLKIVDEEKVTWQQVLEFRKDKNTLKKYKRFLHWLDREMLGKSQAFIEDEIAQRLEDYEHGLKKHGIKTILGMIEETLDGRYLFGAPTVIGSLIGHPILGILTGAGLLVGKVGVKLFETLLDFDDIERGANSEISWIYETKKLGK